MAELGDENLKTVNHSAFEGTICERDSELLTVSRIRGITLALILI